MRVVGVKAKQKCRRTEKMWKPPAQRREQALQDARAKLDRVLEEPDEVFERIAQQDRDRH